MTHSFSSISTFEKCPRHYEAQYILKTVRFTGSDATREGERIHKALEKYIDGSSDEPPRRVPSDGLHDVLRGLYPHGMVQVEQEVAVTKDLTPCGFWDKEAYLRGKIDVSLALPDSVTAWDWKSGKRRNNALQASVYSVLLSPLAKPVTIYFDYLDQGRDAPITGKPQDVPSVMQKAEAIDGSTVFPPRPSPLCRWCPVTNCEFNQA